MCTHRWLEKISEGEDGAIATGTTGGRGEREQRPGYAVLPASAVSATTADADADYRRSEAQSRGPISHPEANLSGADEPVDRRAALKKLTGRFVSGLSCRAIMTEEFTTFRFTPRSRKKMEHRTGSKLRVLSLAANPRLVESPRALRGVIDQIRRFLHARRIPNYYNDTRSFSGSTIPRGRLSAGAHIKSLFFCPSTWCVCVRKREREKGKKKEWIEIENVVYLRWALFHFVVRFTQQLTFLTNFPFVF